MKIYYLKNKKLICSLKIKKNIAIIKNTIDIKNA